MLKMAVMFSSDDVEEDPHARQKVYDKLKQVLRPDQFRRRDSYRIMYEGYTYDQGTPFRLDDIGEGWLSITFWISFSV